MPKFVIERAIPGLGRPQARRAAVHLPEILRRAAANSAPTSSGCKSYLTEGKMYCIYNAASEELVREHARRGGFPADSVTRVTGVIDPTTAEA